jgi:hypothetical protein
MYPEESNGLRRNNDVYEDNACQVGNGRQCSCHMCIRVYNRKARRALDTQWYARLTNDMSKTCTFCKDSGHVFDECASYIDYSNELNRRICIELNK